VNPMLCAKCNTENPEGLKFCNECRAPFETPCAWCGFENAPAAANTAQRSEGRRQLFLERNPIRLRFA
jgi:hypothetical protein